MSSVCGIITNLGTQLTDADALELLEQAGLSEFLDPDDFVSDRDANVAKPHTDIYRFAAQQTGVPIAQCASMSEKTSSR